MDRLSAMQLFVRVVESGSFSRAAKSAGVNQPAVSKQIAALEQRLGAQLLRRSARGLTLTDAGHEFFETATRLIAELDEAEARLAHAQKAPSGRIRVAMSAGIGRMHLLSQLPAFFERYPDLQLDLDISERYVNLVEDGVDVAIRIGPLADSALMARRIGSVEFVTVATPGYLAQHGEPATPEALHGHACIGYLFDGAPRPWRFDTPSGSQIFEPTGRLRTNDAEHIRAAALAGLGIAHAPGWLFADALEVGTVRPVLASFATGAYPISAVRLRGQVPQRVRVFVDFLATIFAGHPQLRVR